MNHKTKSKNTEQQPCDCCKKIRKNLFGQSKLKKCSSCSGQICSKCFFKKEACYRCHIKANPMTNNEQSLNTLKTKHLQTITRKMHIDQKNLRRANRVTLIKVILKNCNIAPPTPNHDADANITVVEVEPIKHDEKPSQELQEKTDFNDVHETPDLNLSDNSDDMMTVEEFLKDTSAVSITVLEEPTEGANFKAVQLKMVDTLSNSASASSFKEEKEVTEQETVGTDPYTSPAVFPKLEPPFIPSQLSITEECQKNTDKNITKDCTEVNVTTAENVQTAVEDYTCDQLDPCLKEVQPEMADTLSNPASTTSLKIQNEVTAQQTAGTDLDMPVAVFSKLELPFIPSPLIIKQCQNNAEKNITKDSIKYTASITENVQISVRNYRDYLKDHSLWIRFMEMTPEKHLELMDVFLLQQFLEGCEDSRRDISSAAEIVAEAKRMHRQINRHKAEREKRNINEMRIHSTSSNHNQMPTLEKEFELNNLTLLNVVAEEHLDRLTTTQLQEILHNEGQSLDGLILREHYLKCVKNLWEKQNRNAQLNTKPQNNNIPIS